MFLKVSTAYTFRLGPFVDSTDGNTEENSLTIAAASILLSKAGGALAAKNEATALTGTGANAHYTCVLDATDTNTVGTLRVWAHITGSLPVYKDFMVLPANVYDSLVAGTDNLNTELDTIKGQTVTCAAGVTILASVGTAATATAQTGDSYALANGANGFVAIKGDTAAILVDTGTTLDARIPAALDTGRMIAKAEVVSDKTGYAIGVGGIAAAAFAANALDAAALAADAAAEIADKLLGRNLAGGSDGGRTVKQALRLLRNKRAVAGGTLTAYQEDDVTADWTATVTTAAGNPIDSIDPA